MRHPLARVVGGAELFTGRPDVVFRMYPRGLRELVDGWTRSLASGVLLPDGTVFVCGGIQHTNSPCALFDPETDSWTAMAAFMPRLSSGSWPTSVKEPGRFAVACRCMNVATPHDGSQGSDYVHSDSRFPL